MTSSAWWTPPGIPWSHTWGLILSSHSFWSLSIGEGVMGSLVVTRSCRALGAEKLPNTRVVPSLVSVSLPNKRVGHSGTTRNVQGECQAVRIGKRSLEWWWLKDKEGKSPQKQNKGSSEDQNEDLRQNKQHSWLAQFTQGRPTGRRKKHKRNQNQAGGLSSPRDFWVCMPSHLKDVFSFTF